MKFLVVHHEITDAQRLNCRKFGFDITAAPSF
jgi:hypothetical protein